MVQVMLSLDGFKFNIDSTAYNELVRTWQWNSQARIGYSDLLQYTGKAPVKISLNGQVATTLREVGVHQIEKLAALGNQNKPQLLVSGLWVMTGLIESNTKFIKGGLARLQFFSLELAYYGDDLQNP